MAATPNALSLPCLVFDYGGSAEQPATTVFSVSDGAHRACEDEELRGKRVWPTSSGWVLVWDPDTSVSFLWNPSSAPAGSDRIALPPMAQPPPAGSFCALSGSPTATSGCTVVVSEPGDCTVLWYCHVTSATPAWTRHVYDIGSVTVNAAFLGGDYTFKRTIHGLAPHRGKLYYLHSLTELGVIDLSSAAPAFSTVPVKDAPHRNPAAPGRWVQAFEYLVCIADELHRVAVVFHGPDLHTVVDVCVHRVSFARNELVRVDSIGDRALLLAGNSSEGWCAATEYGLLPNSVYWMSPRDKRLHLFDIVAGTEIVQDPCKGVAEPERLPFWVIPVHPA